MIRPEDTSPDWVKPGAVNAGKPAERHYILRRTHRRILRFCRRTALAMGA